MSVDIEHLKQWVGKTEVRTERIGTFPANALAATLDREDPPYTDGMALPPMWHLVHFLPLARMSGLGPDGHPKRGGFLPPVPLPRRMWAGGRFVFKRPLIIGDAAQRQSSILSVEHKEGRGGPLVFVKVGFEFRDSQGIALTEERDIVYREAQAPGAPQSAGQPAPADAAWERIIHPDPVLLFRYSALTFNGHRIHYDHRFVTEQEGYPGLIVHGPLIATLLVDLLRRARPEATLETFAFRAVKPLFAPGEFAVCGAPAENGKTVRLWTRDTGGALTMEASASLA